MGGKGGGGGGTTQTIQKADPWVEVQPYLKGSIYPAAQSWYQGAGPQYYPYSTVTNQSPETLQAMQLLKQRALAGSPLEQMAQAQNYMATRGDYLTSSPAMPYYQAASSGAFLNANPYVNALFSKAAAPISEQFQNAVLPGVASQFSLGGRYGSGAHQQALQTAENAYGRTMADLAANIYGGNYALERQLQSSAASNMADAYNRERYFQEQAAAQAPGLANTDYQRLQQLAAVGAAREGYQQSLLDDLIARWNFAQTTPLEKLKEYNQIISGGAQLGGSTFGQSTVPRAQSNPLLGAIGGGASGYALGGALGGAANGATYGPWGALIGAVLGGLLS